jgi:hypothetical protein
MQRIKFTQGIMLSFVALAPVFAQDLQKGLNAHNAGNQT